MFDSIHSVKALMQFPLRASNVVVNVLVAVCMVLNWEDVVAAPASLPSDSNIQAVVRSSNQFSFDLYAKLRAESEGNLFFSPQSVVTALTMTYAGASGDTAKQMAKVLHYDFPDNKLHPAAAALLNHLNSLGAQDGVQLSIANRLWGQEGYRFSGSFVDLLRREYHADLEKLDFAQTESARQTINNWVDKATAGRITDIIPPDMLDPLSRLVLTNAVYFKGDWENAFDEADTKPSEFHVSETNRIDNVPTMHQEGSFRFGQFQSANNTGVRLLVLPYKGQRLSMVVLLPDAVDGLDGLEHKLTADQLQQWLEAAEWAEVLVWLPKFRMLGGFQLGDVLSAMGMKSAFQTGWADFSKIDGSKALYLSAVVHKAFVEVNERGTEAAGAVAAAPPIPAPAPPEFRADHPFMFVILDDTTGVILFMGRVVDPR